MADPIVVIGTTGAIANIIHVVSKAIIAVHNFQGRWKEADLAFLSLVTQLTALRAALTKIKEWSDSESSESEYQLTMDLDVALSCCGLLISKLDTFLQDLDQTTDQPLDFRGKVKFVFGTRDLEDVQKMIGRQVSALTLLLTACNW